MKAISIEEKYNMVRSFLRNGDIILFHGTKLLAKTIQYLDNCYYNHIGIIVESNGRLLIIDSNAGGVDPDFLSHRIKEYSDFCIIKPIAWSQEIIDNAVSSVIEKAETLIKYDFKLLFRIALYRKFGKEVVKNNQDKDVCSEFVRRYLRFYSPVAACYESPKLPYEFITPFDYLLYADENFLIKYNKCEMSKFRLN